MIKAFNCPQNRPHIDFIKELVSATENSGLRQAVILPTERALRELAYSNFLYSDIYSIKEWSSFIRKTDKIYLPDELRIIYLRKASLELFSKGDFKLFGENSGVFLESLSSFQAIAPAILSFYREIAAELLELQNLYKSGLYTDYESQVKSLMVLWHRYIELINSDGYTDRWEELKKVDINDDFIERYDRYFFILTGYLTMAEVEELKIIGSKKELVFINTFIGKKDNRYLQYEKFFDIEISDSYNLNLTDSNCKIYECVSTISQVEVIVSQAAYYNEKFNIPYNRMAVILPNDELRRYFLSLDNYEIFDITGNEEISYSVIHQLLILLKSVSILKDTTSYIAIDDLVKILYSPFLKRMIDVENYIATIKKTQIDGKLFLKIDEIEGVEFISDIDKLYKKESVAPIEAIATFCEILSSFKPYIFERERKSFNDIRSILERAKNLFKDIDIMLSVDEAIDMILSIFSKLTIQTPKGQIAVSGILESRCLNYDIVFIIDLLDSNFPPKSKKELFLNTEMRQQLNLPTFIDRDNLLKNYIFQLIAQSKATVILYSATERSSRSRFIDELIFIYKLSVERYDLTFISKKISPISYNFNNKKLIIEKNEEMIERIKKITLSATSVNMLHQCGLQFYFRYLLSVREVEEPVKELSNLYIGNAFHKAFELVKNNSLLLAGKERFIFEFKAAFFDAINRYDSYQFSHINKIMVNSCMMLLPDIYDYELNRNKEGYNTVATEYDINLEAFNGFSLRGKIDRVDERHGVYDIIDYKFKDAPLKDISLIDNIYYHKLFNENFDSKKVNLQLPFYSFILSKKEGKKIANAMHYILKENLTIYNLFDTERLGEFESYLTVLLEKLADINTPFIAEPNAENCGYCLYRDICSK